MIIPSAIERQYSIWLPYLKEAKKRIESTLFPFCRKEGYVFEGRIKTLESLAEKIESGRFPSWDKLDDLYACTIAVPLYQDEEIVCDSLRQKFNVISIKQRGSVPKSPEVFRFDSTRVNAKLRKPQDTDIGEELSIFKIRFEIQIKSLFEFAWAKTTHALTYKSNMVDWKRHRLAAHLKAAVEQADFLLVGFEEAAQLVTNGRSHDLEDKSKLRDFFVKLVEKKTIPAEFTPKDWSRFIDNIYMALQVLEKQSPSGRSYRPLKSIDTARRLLEQYFLSINQRLIPRSLSLFQIVIGVLCSSGEFEGAINNYYFFKGEMFDSVFPDADIPGKEFYSVPNPIKDSQS